jgi:hypothetical protein
VKLGAQPIFHPTNKRPLPDSLYQKRENLTDNFVNVNKNRQFLPNLQSP